MNIKQIVKGTAIWLLIVSQFAECTTDEPISASDSGIEKEEGVVTVTLNIPSQLTVNTYAMEMTTKQECEISTIDVLVFDPDGRFLFYETGTDIADGTTDTKKKFSMKIKKNANSTNITALVYANVREQIEAATNKTAGWIKAGSTKNEVISGLIFDLPSDQTSENQGGKWLVLPGRYTRFPMWGQTGTIDLTQATISIPEVSMLRAVAKIDVGLNFPRAGTPVEQDVAAGLSNFFLEEVYLYNAYNKLQVAPTEANLTGAVVTAPSLPTGKAVFGNADSPIAYVRRTYHADGYKSLMNAIYLAEHEAGSNTDRPNNPCIVVGGRFGSVTEAITYYRIDMIHSTIDTNNVVVAQKYLPLLRNHRYKVNITSVRRRGYDTAKEAFEAMGVNTNLTVVVTNQDEKITEIVYDGQYMLGAEQTNIKIDKRASTVKELYINTDYPKGWKARVNSEASGWLLLDKATGTNGGSVLKYHTTENSATNAVPRSGTITIQAGRLTMDIQVTQSNLADIEFFDVSRRYSMDMNNCTFNVVSKYDWKVKVEDEYNIIARFDLSGSKNSQKTRYNFKLVNDIVVKLLKDKTAVMTFYSERGEFEPATVSIRGVSSFVTLGGVEVYSHDQPIGQSWFAYANVQNNYYVVGVQKPGAIGQLARPREFSCAAIPGLSGTKAWRLPTNKELRAIAAEAAKTPGTLASNGFTNDVYYWSATSESVYHTYAVVVSTAAETNHEKLSTTIKSRCVRNK